MQRALDFDKTLPLGAPLPFLLNAPLFALLAGALASWAGPQAFSARWAPAALALTHLWTLGVLGSVMLGALIQILAVACNVPVARPRLLARWVHALFSVGTLLLVAGLLWPLSWARQAGAGGLAAAFGLYFAAVFQALWQHREQVYPGAREILIPVRGALAALVVTVLLGLLAATATDFHAGASRHVDLHVLWGLFGWGGLLLMGMSFQLLPIFQLTELYPRSLTRWGPLLIPGLLLAWTVLYLGDEPPRSREVVALLLALAYTHWAAVTLQRLWTRKRPTAEPTSLFWFTCVVSLLACLAGWLVWLATVDPRWVRVGGVLFIIGGLGSAVNGMLYKIVPFLMWKHAQNAMIIPDHDPTLVRGYLRAMPRMAAYLPVRLARTQWALHVAVIISWGLAAAGLPAAGHAAGPLLLACAGLLAWNLGYALRLYRRTLRILAHLPHHRAAHAAADAVKSRSDATPPRREC